MKYTKLVLIILFVLINFALCSNLQYSSENEIESEIAAADCVCKNGFCEKDKNGKLVCKCPSDYGLFQSDCYKCDCGDGSTCTWSGVFTYTKKCICKKGYSDVSGKCKGDCKQNPCENGGTCRVVGNEITCDCVSPYSGENCKENISSSTHTFSSIVSRSTPLSSTTTTYTSSSLTEISANDTEPPETTTYITNTAIPSSTSTSHETIFTSGKASTSIEDTNSTINLEINSITALDINSTEILSTTTGNDTERTASDEGSLSSILTTESEPNITMIDWCASNPCQNGGYCRNRIDTFQCMCTGIYGGQDCSENIFCELYGEDLCGREMCQYSDRTRRGYCVCEDGKVFNKASKTCTDPCTPSPCQNGAACSVDGTTYKYFCKELYLGTNCEYDWRYIMAAVLLLVLLASIIFCRGCHVYRPTQNFILRDSDGYKNLHNIP